MDTKHLVVYGKMKIPGVGAEFDYSDSQGVIGTMQLILRDLSKLKRTPKGEIIIRISAQRLDASPESEALTTLIDQLEITQMTQTSPFDDLYNELLLNDLIWRQAMSYNYAPNYDKASESERREAFRHYTFVCNLNPGLRDFAPIRWVSS
jgi:hypothetical protein